MESSTQKPSWLKEIEGNFIGFANEYYTLWFVKSFSVWNGQCYTYEIKYTYKQNLSKDLEEAQRKAVKFGVKDLEPDPALKGESGSWSTGKQKIYPAESFSFGKFQGQTIADKIETESDYVLWYFNEVYYQEDIYGKKTPKEWFGGSAHAENMKVRIAHIIELFKASDSFGRYKNDDGQLVWTTSERLAKIKARRRKAASSEYYGNVGERTEVEMKLDFTTSFESSFGRCYVQTFKSANHVFVYMGKDLGVDKGEKVNMKFTIKDHSEFRGVKQTKISRPTIL